MTFWYGSSKQEDATLPGAGGEATLGAIADAALKSAWYVDNSFAADAAQEEAIDQRNAAIAEATGIKLDNPYRVNVRIPSDTPGRMFGGDLASRKKQYEQRLATLSEQHPNAASAIRAGTGVLAAGTELARASDARLAQVMESRSGIGKWGAALAGGFRGSLSDPIQVLMLGLGGELSAAKTVFGAIGKTALKEALINGASEAALQPMVQAWRETAGLDHGFDVAFNNVLFAAGIGGAFGAVAGGAQAVLRPRVSGAALDGAMQAATPRLTPEVQTALNGADTQALRQTLDPIRDALPAEARGALDAADIDAHALASKPAKSHAIDHANAVALADRQVLSGEPVDIPVDMDRVNRLAALEYTVRAKGTAAPKQTGARAQTISEFVMNNGGFSDAAGDAASRDLNVISRPGMGKLMTADGKALDDMREMAAEAGYFTGYGTPQEAIARSTPDELIDLIERDLQGTPQYSVFDMAEGRVNVDDVLTLKEARAQAARHIEPILREGGPGLDDELVSLAARHYADGLDAGSAIEKAARDLNAIGTPAAPARAFDDIPFFEPTADGIDDVPATLASDEALTADELAAYGDFNDDGLSIDDMIELAKHDDDMAFILSNCKLR
jgi:hypothetical protein